jgi:hypothetical protein
VRRERGDVVHDVAIVVVDGEIRGERDDVVTDVAIVVVGRKDKRTQNAFSALQVPAARVSARG